MNNLDELISNLSCNRNHDKQNISIKQLQKIKDDNLSLLIMPSNRKSTWENAAKVLVHIGYPRIQPIVFELIDWLQDINWPGAIQIIDLLTTVDKKKLVIEIEKKLEIKVVDDVPIKEDDMWLCAINMLLK